MTYETPWSFIIHDPSFLLLAYFLAGVIAYLGYRARALTPGGAIAACLVGGMVFGFGGLGWAILLVLFFASSSLLSFVKATDARKERAAETFEKGGKRDAAQVLANGGIAALIALLWASQGPANWLFGAFLGALATATADTWATEVGVLSNRKPRLVTTGKIVPAGTSGGVTWLGTGAGAAGALVIGLAGAPMANSLLPIMPATSHSPVVLSAILAAFIGGMAGTLADSLLGAAVQASYWCPACAKPTESRIHRCGTPTRVVRGLSWVNNDLVNLLATATGALAGSLTWQILANSLS